MMNIGSNEGMRLANAQPPPGFSMRHNVADPRLHRLGLMRMAVDSLQPFRDPETGKRSLLIVRDADLHAEAFAKAKLVCMHPMCADKTFANEAELKKAHGRHEAMAAEGERHVFGWYSGEPIETPEKSKLDMKKVQALAASRLRAAEKVLAEATDDEKIAAAIVKFELAEKNVAALRRMAVEKAQEIVGYLVTVE